MDDVRRDDVQDEGSRGLLWPVRDADVDALIDRAARHELGTTFLVEGAQDSVAATFGVHAFLVDAARARLNGDA